MTLRRYRNKYFVGAKRWVTTPGAVETASYAGVSEETDSILVVSPPSIFRTELAKASAIAVGDLSRFYAATRDGVVAIFNAAAVILESAALEADGNAIAVNGDVVYLSRTGARLARVDDLAVSYESCLTRGIAGIIVGSGVLYVMTDDARLLTVHEDEVRETFDIIDELTLPAAFGLRDFVLTDEVLYLVGTDRLGNGSVVAVDVEDPEAPELLSVDRVESPFVVLTTDGFGHVGTEQPQTPYTTPNVPWQGRTDCIRTAGAPLPPPVDEPPVNTVPPALSGSPEVGVEIACDTGTWTGTEPITYSYQWQRDNGGPVEDIGDSTNAYTVEEADLGYSIYCLVTATNTAGEASALSDTFVIADPPVNTVQPVITGSTVVGQILSCSDGTWTGAAPITFTYAWYHDGDEGTTLGTDATYEIESGDVGFAMVCRVTATNTFGDADIAANPTDIVVPAMPVGIMREWDADDLAGVHGGVVNTWPSTDTVFTMGSTGLGLPTLYVGWANGHQGVFFSNGTVGGPTALQCNSAYTDVTGNAGTWILVGSRYDAGSHYPFEYIFSVADGGGGLNVARWIAYNDGVGPAQYLANLGDSSGQVFATTDAYDDPTIYVLRSQPTSPKQSYWQDGVMSDSSEDTPNLGISATMQFGNGPALVNSTAWLGVLSRLLFWPRALSDGEIADATAVLKTQYGIP